MSLAIPPHTPPPNFQKPPPVNLDWATKFVASMSDVQRKLLEKMYAEAQVEKRRVQEEQEKQERQKAEQQAILDLLTNQVPITVDVTRSSSSPESQTSDDHSCSSSVVGSVGEEGLVTVKDALIGKMKQEHQHIRSVSPYDAVKSPYRPRGPRERVLFDNHMFVFDKYSFDGKKKFFRCERKNTCPARIHTPTDSERVIHRVQTHNHPPPQSFELQHFDINYDRVRSGFILPINMTTSQYIRNTLPTTMLTPKSETDDELKEEEDEKEQTPMDILAKMVTHRDSCRKAVTLRLPELFKDLSEKENHDIEMAMTRFLLLNHELRNEFMNSNGDFPVLFPDAKKNELVLFVADYNQEDGAYQMLKIKERNERSIRDAIEDHLGGKCNRSLMINVSAKINVPLSQQMIDQWRTEEFIRLDSSKPNTWKIHHVSKVDN